MPWREFLTGVKQTAREPGELILGARWNVPRGPGSFSKIGTRNAMVIAVANLCLQVDEDGRSVRVALGSVAPTVVRAERAETFAAQAFEDAGLWDDPRATLAPGRGRTLRRARRGRRRTRSTTSAARARTGGTPSR